MLSFALAALLAVFVGQTNLTIHVSGASVSGTLAGNPACRADQTVALYVDGAKADQTTTDADGAYTFTDAVGATLQTRFAGSQTGVHPNRTVCEPSVSRVVGLETVPATVAASVAPTTAFTGEGGPNPLVIGILVAGLTGLGVLLFVSRRHAEGLKPSVPEVPAEGTNDVSGN